MSYEGSGRMWRLEKLLAAQGFSRVLEGGEGKRASLDSQGEPDKTNKLLLHENYTGKAKSWDGK